MKKLVFVLLAVLTIASCQKKETQPTTPATQDVTFSVTEITPDLKSTDDWECKDNIPTNAWVKIDGLDYYPALFELDGQLYTQAIKLAEADNYCVQTFVLYEELDGTPGYLNTGDGGDVIVFGTPMEDNDDTQGYDAYVQWPLEYCFDVAAFAKAEIPIEVLCFQDAEYQNFGFDWFAVTEIVIRQACFFGDICIDDPALYAYSIYDDAINGVQVDEEAAIRVIVKEGVNEVPYSPFDNLSIYGNGQVLCVDYPDNLSIDETFTFELQVWVPSAFPGIFVWQTYATYTTTDDNPLTETDNDQDANTDNDDGVVDFAVGDCSPDSYPVYQWLAPISPEPVIVTENDLARTIDDVIADPTKWFYYDDASRADVGIFDPTFTEFVDGPGTPLYGTGSAQIVVDGSQQFNLATYQFGGIPLADITAMSFVIYNPTPTNYSGYINFGVDFEGTGSWQGRLVYTPQTNNTFPQPSVWTECNAIDGTALWWWTGFDANGGYWPDGNTNKYRPWSEVAGITNAKTMDGIYTFFGIRVDDFGSAYTENIDAFKLGVNGVTATFDFEP